jgi:uncharacterized membrane protein YfcA
VDGALDTWQWLFAGVVVTAGAAIQASVGFGYALAAAPVLALVSPALVPGAVLSSSFVLCVAIALRELRHADLRGVAFALIGRLPGAWLGALALALVSGAAVELLFSAIVLCAVWMSLSGLRLRSSPGNLLALGMLTGVMGTMTSIGGPPIALVYQHEQGPRLRATLSAYFAVGSLISIAALAFYGRFGVQQLKQSVLLLPPVAIGLACSSLTRPWLDRGRTRAGVLLVAAASAAALIAKALWP